MSGSPNAREDVFVRTIATGLTVRASVSSAGAQGTSTSNDPSLSADGRRVGFYSTASNLVASDTNSRGDVFLRDLAAGTTVRKSLTASGGQANEASSDPWLSGDGLSLSFRSVATNLVPEDTDATPDVYVRGPGTDASAYAYDRLSRLTSATEPSIGATTYTYDSAGNRLTRVRGGTSTAYAYDRADRITAAGAMAITVSAVGTTTARGSDAFAYDQANRLRTATVAGTTETSAYDGDGVRFSRQVGAGPVTRYVTDPAASLPVTVDDGTRKYVWGLGLAYAVAGSTLEVYHPDRLGSTRALTDATGAVVATYRTDEFGTPTTVTGTSSQPFRYTGEPLDASGLTYLRARYYDPSLGRFMSRDDWAGSVAHSQILNRYTYAANNPVTSRDPGGRSPSGFGSLVLTCGGEQHSSLDVAGLIAPPADAINGLIYFCEGDLDNAVISWLSVVPIGDLAKLLRRGVGHSATMRMIGGPAATWNNPATLQDHFTRHAGDIGARTVDEYTSAANRFFTESQYAGYQVKIDVPHDTVRIYDPSTNTFGSYTLDGLTRTFFKPDPAMHPFPSNMDWWLAQTGELL